MKLLGEKIFAKDGEGKLISRIGTMFFHTPGLVTRCGVHAMQRAMWLEELNREREAVGADKLTEKEEGVEMSESVDLIFTEELVLIRPDPERMDLALRADEILCGMVSKRRVRYLNTNSAKVREMLTSRGENWRMARQPISQEDMTGLIERSRVAIGELPVYYYNSATGSRFLTAGGYDAISALDDAAYRRQMVEIIEGLSKRNRHGQPEVDLFPQTIPIEIKKSFRMIDYADMSDAELRRAVDRIEEEWRMALPPELREESTENFEWRNTMCHTITRQPNETSAEEQELARGIAAEFYRQIEWLPGARMSDGELIFDELYEEAERTGDPEFTALCDNRVKSLIFNFSRLYGAIEFINVGRIARSLARHPIAGSRRGNVYIVQYRELGRTSPEVKMVRFQKWGVAERLDEGKDLLRAIVESDEYSDYILDRRLMCRQLGMNLPRRIAFGHLTEKYRGDNQYNGSTVRTAYFVRPYVHGTATDKIPPAQFHNPAWAKSFARLMGEAAAIDLIVGRRSSESGEMLFDGNYETLVLGPDGLPREIVVTDHAGSFVEYERELTDLVVDYAGVALRRRQMVGDYASFAQEYVKAVVGKFSEVQQMYRARREAFDRLFEDRPFDTNGSGAFRWSCALARLDRTDPNELRRRLDEAVRC